MSETLEIGAILVAMERSALDRWGKGDPAGYLQICDLDVVYFDNAVDTRLDGLEALTRLHDSIRGKIFMDRHELVNPKAQLCGDAAVLTFNFIGYVGEKAHRWNCTEVYRRRPQDDAWRIIHTHWSLTAAGK
jgi:hypothetical protein